MTKSELTELSDYLTMVVEHIPNRWNDVLYEAVTFALFEINCALDTTLRAPSFTKALAFAQSIPKFSDFDEEAFFDWINNDKEHLKYYPL